jgi:hypothetical protein
MERVAGGEEVAALLAGLGFEPDGEHLRFAAEARAA